MKTPHILLPFVAATLFCATLSAQLPAQSALWHRDSIAAHGLQRPLLTVDTKFTRPLTEVLAEVEARFSVKFRYSKGLLDGLELTYASYRIVPWSLETTLDHLLLPFDLKYIAKGQGVYELKAFEYARHTVAYGRDYLDYLATLYDNREAWEQRRDNLRREMFHLAGLDVMPAAPKGKPYLSRRRVYGDYYVQNIGLEVLPGVYCTGSIYHPMSHKKASCPVMLNPNGHFGDGRYRADEQKRCAMQAKMGCIAVSYDLFAWDEQQLQFESRSHATSLANTVQLLFGMRLLDYLLSLPEADARRVGVTGGSGGGSMTMMLTALDERINLSIPVVMTSSYFLGGCPCESGNATQTACGGTNNVEIAAICAPHPMLVISDGRDWTADVPEVEYPFLRRTYGFYGAEDKVENAHFASEGHDYGLSKRLASYDFLRRHWQLDTRRVGTPEGGFDESSVVVEDYALLKVWGPKGEFLPQNALKGIENLYRLVNGYAAETGNGNAEGPSAR